MLPHIPLRVVYLCLNPRSAICNLQSHWLTFIHKQADVAFWLGEYERACEQCRGLRAIALHVTDVRLKHQRLNAVSVQPIRLSRWQQARQERACFFEPTSSAKRISACFGDQPANEHNIFFIARVCQSLRG